jgi:hypothetical protein
MTDRRALLAAALLVVGLAVWRLTHPRGTPWGNRWGEPEEGIE